MARRVIIVEGRAYDPETGEAIGYRPSDPIIEGEQYVPTLGAKEAQRLEAERKVALEEKRAREEGLQVVEKEVKVPAKVSTKVYVAPEEVLAKEAIPPSEPTFRERVYAYVGKAEEFVAKPLVEKTPWYIGRPIAGFVSFGALIPKTAIDPRKAAEEVKVGAEYFKGMIETAIWPRKMVEEKFEKEAKLIEEKGVEVEKVTPEEYEAWITKQQKEARIGLAKEAIVMAETVAIGYGVMKGYQYLKAPKIVGVKVPAKAKEIIKIPEKGIVVYKVKAEPVVFLKKPFRKPYPVKIGKVIGEARVRPRVTGIEKPVYEIRAVYKAPKVKLMERVKGIVWKEKKITKAVGAAEIYKIKKSKIILEEKLIYFGKARRVAKIKAPGMERELIASIGELYLLGKKPPKIRITKPKPIPEKGMMIIERIPKEIPKIEFLKIKPIKIKPIKPSPILKPKVIEKPPAPTIFPIIELAKKAVAPMIKPKPAKVITFKPIVKPLVKPAIEEVVKVMPLVAEKIDVRLAEKVIVKERITVKERVAEMVIPKLAIKELVKTKQVVAEQLGLKQIQQFATKQITVPIVPSIIPPIPFKPFMPILWGKGLERPPRRIKIIEREWYYPKEEYKPSLLAMEFKIFEKPSKIIKEVGMFGIRPIPIRKRRKLLFQDLGI